MNPGKPQPSASTSSDHEELVAYEYLWAQKGTTFKTISEMLSGPTTKPTQVVSELVASLFGDTPEELAVVKRFLDSKVHGVSFALKSSPGYPKQLLDAKYPLSLFYYRGDLSIARSMSISVVGTRGISADGVRRTKKITTMLARSGFTIVSGLAAGTDTVALQTAIEVGAKVIAVIGTPVDEYYPKENRELQDRIATDHLLISQVPFYRYSIEPFPSKRIYFVERDATMAAISQATVIVEAGETSGTLIQARACLDQGRPVFILNSCFENPKLTWPRRFEQRGAIRVTDIDDILVHLSHKGLSQREQ